MKNFRKLISLIEVKENEIAIRLVNGIYRDVLLPGRYFYFTGLNEIEVKVLDVNSIEIPDEILKLLRSRGVLKTYIREFQSGSL